MYLQSRTTINHNSIHIPTVAPPLPTTRDVLEAPTEDQLDVGSSVVVVTGKDKENARTDRQKYHSSISGGGGGGSQSSAWGVAASSTRGGAAPSTAAATRAGTTVATYHVGGAKVREGMEWGRGRGGSSACSALWTLSVVRISGRNSG